MSWKDATGPQCLLPVGVIACSFTSWGSLPPMPPLAHEMRNEMQSKRSEKKPNGTALKEEKGSGKEEIQVAYLLLRMQDFGEPARLSYKTNPEQLMGRSFFQEVESIAPAKCVFWIEKREVPFTLAAHLLTW